MVGWVSPRGWVSSQTQASPPSWAATMETSRSRVGVGQGLERPGQVGGLGGADRLLQQGRRAAFLGEREQGPGAGRNGCGHLWTRY
jgi:hypothetical protein